MDIREKLEKAYECCTSNPIKCEDCPYLYGLCEAEILTDIKIYFLT